MMEKGAARRGGMPLYKYAGNRILSRVQNRLLGTNLSEFHSGYRAYAVPALSGIPFEFNTNDFHFDTEIIIELAAAGRRIREVPIPTYYGDEICRVNGIAYAWNVVRATIAYRLHRMGLLYRYAYDIPDGAGPRYGLKLGYPSSHTLAIAAVPPGSRALDLGCGEGCLVAAELVKKGCLVAGADLAEAAAGGILAEYHRMDLDRDPIPPFAAGADHVLLLDAIEHLADPEAFLLRLRRAVDPGRARVIVTTPNVGFIVTRLMLLLGSFNYGRVGILDKTHRRLFTFPSLLRLLRQAGFTVETVRGIPAPFPKAIGKGLPARILLALNGMLIRLSRRLFSYQIFVTARVKPTLDAIAERTREHSARAAGAHGADRGA